MMQINNLLVYRMQNFWSHRASVIIIKRARSIIENAQRQIHITNNNT